MLKKFNTLFEEVSTFLEKENKLNGDSGSDSSEGENTTAEECCDGSACDVAEPNTDVTPVKPGITTDDVKEMYVGTLPFKKIQKRKDFGY
jgi:hypothetical protein